MNPHREPPPAGPRFTRSGYHLRPGLVMRVLASMILRRRRDLYADAARLLAPPSPPSTLAGAENIPAASPFLLVMNHYTRPGLDAWWPAILATWAVGRARPGLPLRWLMVSEWAWPTWEYRFFITPATRLLFAGMAATYGFLLAPPVLNSDYSPQTGALAVRRFVAAAREAAAAGHALAIAPEGRDGPLGALTTLPPGAGRFLILLAGTGLPVLPVAVSEDPPGRLLARFGRLAPLDPPPGLPRADQDVWAAGEVMGRLAALLPPPLRGPYDPVGPDGA